MSARAIPQIFQQYAYARTQFAQCVADAASRAELVSPLLTGNAIYLLRNLLTDVSPVIQQHATTAIGRLAAHDARVAANVVQLDIVPVLLYLTFDKCNNRFLRRSALMAIRSIVKHSAELAEAVLDVGGLEQIVGLLDEFDPTTKEAAAWVLGYIARHNEVLAQRVIDAGAVPLLVLCLQEPETNVRQVAASALGDISKHSGETGLSVIDAGALNQLTRGLLHTDSKLKKQSLQTLASLAKDPQIAQHLVLDHDLLHIVLEHCSHNEEPLRRAASLLLKDIVRHSPQMAQIVIEAGAVRPLIECAVRNCGEAKVPALMALGFIAGHGEHLAAGVVQQRGGDAAILALDDEKIHVASAAAWLLGHIARHSKENAKSVNGSDVLSKIMNIYSSPAATQEIQEQSSTALLYIISNTENIDELGPLVKTAPEPILQRIMIQYSKVLPNDSSARRNFVASGDLRQLQDLMTSGRLSGDSAVNDYIKFINQCFPEDVVKHFSPNYPETLLQSVELYQPEVVQLLNQSEANFDGGDAKRNSIHSGLETEEPSELQLGDADLPVKVEEKATQANRKTSRKPSRKPSKKPSSKASSKLQSRKSSKSKTVIAND